MKKPIFVLIAAILSSSAIADTTTLTIAKPMSVNKKDLKGYSVEAADAVNILQSRLRLKKSDVNLGSTEFDYIADGKIYTIYDFVKMPIEQVISIMSGSYCGIGSDIYTVKKEWSWSKLSYVVASVSLKGSFHAENWYPNAANYGTYMDLENGKGTVVQKLFREYSVSEPNGKKAYVFCMTILKSTTADEAEANYGKYASDVFGPLKSALGL